MCRYSFDTTGYYTMVKKTILVANKAGLKGRSSTRLSNKLKRPTKKVVRIIRKYLKEVHSNSAYLTQKDRRYFYPIRTMFGKHNTLSENQFRSLLYLVDNTRLRIEMRSKERKLEEYRRKGVFTFFMAPEVEVEVSDPEPVSLGEVVERCEDGYTAEDYERMQKTWDDFLKNNP